MSTGPAPRPASQLRPSGRVDPIRRAAPAPPAAIPDDATVPPSPAVLADAVRVLWIAAHHHAVEVHANMDKTRVRRMIDARCECANVFDAVATLAEILRVELHVVEELCRHAPLTAQRVLVNGRRM